MNLLPSELEMPGRNRVLPGNTVDPQLTGRLRYHWGKGLLGCLPGIASGSTFVVRDRIGPEAAGDAADGRAGARFVSPAAEYGISVPFQLAFGGDGDPIDRDGRLRNRGCAGGGRDLSVCWNGRSNGVRQ